MNDQKIIEIIDIKQVKNLEKNNEINKYSLIKEIVLIFYYLL